MATKRYQIWDHTSNVVTPSGELFTPEQWLDRYPAYCVEGAVMILAKGFQNGALIDELSMMKARAEQMGATFPEGLSNQETLEAIEAFEEELAAASAAAASEPTAEERIAAAMEYQNMLAV